MDFRPRLNEENPDPRVACALVLDVSGSMTGDPITQVNEGLRAFKEEINADALARKRAEILLLTFGGSVEIVQEFCEARELESPDLVATGGTPMGAAIHLALDRIDSRKAQYKEAGLQYFRPWFFLVTDGLPTDMETFKDAVLRLQEEERRQRVAVFTVGVGDGADMDLLGELSKMRQPVRLQGLKFVEMFEWLSTSISAVSHSSEYGTSDEEIVTGGGEAGEQTPLPSPRGWATW